MKRTVVAARGSAGSADPDRAMCNPRRHPLSIVSLLCMSALVANGAFGQTALPHSTVLEPGGSFAPLLEKVIPAVVTIRVVGQKLQPIAIPPRNKDGKTAALPTPATEEFGAGGSGVIVDATQGYIVTNNHVIENATRIMVELSNGRQAIAKLIGTDVGTDIAVIKIDEPNLPSLALSDSDTVRVGDIVAAVGNPFGLEGTATLGIVSALMRSEIGHSQFEDYLQIDAPINPGNSGGALVNVSAELIGINTVVSERGFGIGFAVPSNMVKTTMNALISAGRVRRGSTGLIVEDLPMAMASPPTGGVTRGAIVRRVISKSPAAAADIEPGDIVVSAGNEPVRNAAEFVTRTVGVPLGSAIPMILFSRGQGRSVSLMSTDVVIEPEEITLGPDEGSLAGAVLGEILPGNRLYGDLLGTQILRTQIESPAYWVGLEPGDVIVGIDDARARSVKELKYRISRAGREFRVAIVRNGVPALIHAKR
jgi:serine protease DegQ